MEINKMEEARRAMEIAERKVRENDYDGAKYFVNKAQNLYPNLEGLSQFLVIIDVYICASNGDWYGILGLDPSADDETVKRQYKKLALLLHPDKNRTHGAEGAFKLVSDAWRLLSDKAKRCVYDQQRKHQAKRSVYARQKQRKSDTFDAKRWFEYSNKRFAEKPVIPTGANESEEILRRWLGASKKDLDAAVAFASSRATTHAANKAETAERACGGLKRKSREDEHNANQARQRVKTWKTWLDASRRDMDTAVAAAAARENANYHTASVMT